LRWEDSPRRQLGDHPWRPPASPATHALAPYDKATLNQQDKREKLLREHQRKARKEAEQEEVPPIPPKKRKTVNEFGGGTFWNRAPASKRKPKDDSQALMTNNTPPMINDLIVDTGASHVLFQERHIGLLSHVQLSRPNHKPFAILRAANGQVLTAIGKGIFRIKHISVVAYIFRNADLVHNLLGIATFADCGCKAIFTAKDFSLHHHKTLLMTGKRHSANLWHIALSESPRPKPITTSQTGPLYSPRS
jgi:hypothetical protein